MLTSFQYLCTYEIKHCKHYGSSAHVACCLYRHLCRQQGTWHREDKDDRDNRRTRSFLSVRFYSSTASWRLACKGVVVCRLATHHIRRQPLADGCRRRVAGSAHRYILQLCAHRCREHSLFGEQLYALRRAHHGQPRCRDGSCRIRQVGQGDDVPYARCQHHQYGYSPTLL